MLVIGLTGGIATGKSTVSRLISSPPPKSKAKALPVIDADILARDALAPGSRGLAKVVKAFGPDIVTSNGDLDRAKLGAIIFNDPSKRRVLNSIVHPIVSRALVWDVVKAWLRGAPCVVLDVPLLIEGGMWKWMGYVVVVSCSAEVQESRLVSRARAAAAANGNGNGTENEEELLKDAKARIASQLPITSKLVYADYIIDNSGTPEELERRVADFLADLKKRRWRWLNIVQWVVPPVGLLGAILTLGYRALRSPLRRKSE